VQFASGTQINVEKLSLHAKEVGAKLVIDITQAAGAVPITINDWAVDILVCSGYKWLGSHGGIAFGWFSDEILELDPPAIGWFGNENPFDMEATKLNLSKTAAKYTQSTLSYVSVVGLDVAIEQLLKIGIVEIMNHSDKLAEHLFSIIANSDWKAYRPTKSKGSSSHIVSLMHPSSDTIRRKFEHLSEEGLICGIRNDRLRVSISHYNDSNDIEHLGAYLLRE
jgi:selenocysteine lyase/cysteine desulfurase